MLSLVFLFIALRFSYCQDSTGVDVSSPVSLSQFLCMNNSGYSFTMVRGYQSNGAIDPNGLQTIENAAAAGLYHDTYHFPCFGGVSPQDQVDAIVNYLGNMPGNYWIDVETNPSPGCGWQDPNTNCGFLHNLVSAFQGRGVQLGIYSSYNMWNTIFGGPNNCNQFSNIQLWYANYDGQQSFSDFQPFGGWTTPTVKQFGTGSVCGASVDLNWCL